MPYLGLAVFWGVAHWQACGVRGRARLEAAHSNDLLSSPTFEGECARSMVEDGIGVVVERVRG